MSRSWGNSSANNIFLNTSLISGILPQPFTMLIKIRPNNIGIRQALFSNNNAGSPKLFISIEPADTIRVFLEGADRLVSTAQTFITDQWNSIGVSYHADDSIEIYLAGSPVASGSYTKVGGGATDGAIIGGLTIPGIGGFDVDAELAEFAFYGEALIDDEHAEYADDFSPKLIRPGGLVSYVPIIGEGNSEPDHILGETWEINGTVTKSDHPGIFMPSPAIIGIPVAAAPPAAAIINQFQGSNMGADLYNGTLL